MKIVASNSLTISNINDGTITHIAYAYSADGTDRFTTTYPNLNLLKGTKTPKSVTGNNAANQGGLLYSFDNNNTLTNQGLSINDTLTLEFDWNATNPASGTFILQWQGTPWDLKVPTIKLSSTNGSGHVIHTYNIRAVDIDSTATAIGIGYRLDNVPTNTVITFSNVIIRKTKKSQPWMPSASEVKTADWPSYIGQYTDFTQADSTNPSDYTWSLIRGNDGKDGSDGKDGIAGKDGVGIRTTVITYAISTSGTTAPTAGWTSSVPSLVKGQYLWTKTVWTYTDNSSETGYTVSYISKDGNNGTDGLAGKDGVGIKTTTITYASHTNGTIAPTTGYTTTVPSVPAGQFLWTKTIWTYTDNSFEIGYSVAMMGLKGDKGDQGIKGNDGIAGKDGKGIKATAITYQASTNGTTAPTGTWSASVPTVAKGSFLWTRTIWTYTDNTTETGYAVAYMGTNGNNGTNGIAGKDGVGIKTTTITYAGSTSGTTVPTSGWTSTVPTVPAGQYLWTKTAWTYTDNTSETGYSVAKMGNTGPAGPPGSNGDPGKVIQQNTEPTSKFLNMLWQYTGIEPLNATGITVLSNIIYVWNGTAWQIWLLNPQNIQAVNAWITNAMIGNAAIKLANIDTATITELSAVTATLGDVEAGSITNDISYGFVAQGNHQYLGNSVINYRGINISETVTLDNVLQYTQSMGFDAITGLFFQRLNENQDIISNIRLIEIGNNEMGLYVSNATESATLTSKGLTLSTDVPWTSLTPTGGFNGGSIQFSVQNGVAYFSVSALGVPAMTANNWYQCAQLPTGSSAIPSVNKVTTAFGNASVWGFYVSRSGGLFFQCKSNVSATGNLANALAAFPIG